jgi:bifunctional non-homologous end joining protein LigD
MPRRRADGSGRSSSSQLARYRSKRRFDETPEPRGAAGRAGAAGRSFVIQKHAARRLHYDFRLELDGVLKSWAVTRGPSLDPADRRLAVHVEDHPLEYGGFEGIIPPRQYGAGTVMLWDRGTWEPEGDPRRDYAKGRLRFALKGRHMRGNWLLVRMGGRRARDEKHDNWLLIKSHDRYARPGEGDRLVERVKRSVASGRTMEQLARDPEARRWQSNRGAGEEAANAEPSEARERAPAHLAKLRGAKRAALPDFVAPQLASLVARPPGQAGWIHEIKIDGYRAFCRRDGASVRFLTRREQDWTHRFAPLVAAVRRLPGERLVLDGEVAVLDERGAPSFAALQDALSAGRRERLSYFVFDLLYLDGYDLRGAGLAERKAILRKLLPASESNSPLRYVDHVDAAGHEVYRHACRMALEGVVSKQVDQPYRSGRTRSWLKSKCILRQEFVIGGYTKPRNANRSGIGALVLGYYDGGTLRYAGRVGTGFSDRQSVELRARLQRLAADEAPFAEVPSAARRGVAWVRPELICEIEFRAWTGDGLIRQGSFQGLREDKAARAVSREGAGATPPSAGEAGAKPGSKPSAKRKKPGEALEGRDRRRSGAAAGRPAEDSKPRVVGAPAVAGVAITHPDRVLFPDSGITKLELAEYYGLVGERMLPHIAVRPLSFVRCPTGTGTQCFFQKHFATGLKSLSRVPIREREGVAEYVFVRSAAEIVALIQEGVIEIHPWGARADEPDRPDRLIFDLDPAPEVPWPRVVETALALRRQLAELELESFAKTTGGKGLHVVVPLERRLDWASLKAFARALAQGFVAARPADYTISPMKRDRGGKIFIDYLRNDRGSTAIAPYSARVRPGAPVALPLAWREVTARLRPAEFTLRSLARKLPPPLARSVARHGQAPPIDHGGRAPGGRTRHAVGAPMPLLNFVAAPRGFPRNHSAISWLTSAAADARLASGRRGGSPSGRRPACRSMPDPPKGENPP